MTVAELKREVLVRLLETWAPAALHRARRATYVHGYADADGGALARVALGVFAEQSDLVRGRELTVLAIGDDVSGPDLTSGTRDVSGSQDQASQGGAGYAVHAVSGGTEERLGVALKAAGAARVPLLGFLDASAVTGSPGSATLAALAAGKPAEVLLVLPPGSAADAARASLGEAGFPLVAAVELAIGDDPGELLLYATRLGKSLEAFKETLWAVDEFAGVRYRDPGDPERHLIDISLNPHPGPLRRELLAHLAAAGPASVTDLRTYALTETVYRAADATRVLQTLIGSGTVTRDPEQGRLGGDVLISLP